MRSGLSDNVHVYTLSLYLCTSVHIILSCQTVIVPNSIQLQGCMGTNGSSLYSCMTGGLHQSELIIITIL